MTVPPFKCAIQSPMLSSTVASSESPAPSRRPLVALWRAWLVALVVLGLFPGGYGFVEDAVHLATDGHLVDAHIHVDDSAERGPHDDLDSLDVSDRDHHEEHDCSGAFHTCGCHVAAVFVVDVNGPPSLPPPLLAERDQHRWRRINRAANGDHTNLDRPPRV